MKPQIRTNEGREGVRLIRNAGGALCRKIRAEIAGVKAAVLAEARRMFLAPERLVRLALNEAEAAAWQTKYPHLVFPDLAAEKIEALAVWNARQQSVRRGGPVFALAE
jgi:hypothetical protein